MSKFNSFFRELLYNAGYINNEYQVQYNIPCPFHNEINGASLSINFNKDVFKCFSGKCDGKGISGNIEKLLSMLNLYNSKTLRQIKISNRSEYIEKIENEFEIFKFESMKLYEYSDKMPQYLLDRHISEQVIKDNKCFYSDYVKRIYIPYYFNNQCYGIIGRTSFTPDEINNYLINLANKENITINEFIKLMKKGYYDEKYPELNKYRLLQKYLNTKDMPKKETIYEPLSKLSKNIVYICEGQINSLTCLTNDIYSVALLGSQPSINQVNYIKYNYSNIVLAFDNDEAGNNSAKRFNQIYGKFCQRIDWFKLNKLLKIKYGINIPVNDLNELQMALNGNKDNFQNILFECIKII